MLLFTNMRDFPSLFGDKAATELIIRNLKNDDFKPEIVIV